MVMLKAINVWKVLFLIFSIFVATTAFCHSGNKDGSTKLISSLGPGSLQRIDALLANTDIVRLNFSHDSHVEHVRTFFRVQSWSLFNNKPIKLLKKEVFVLYNIFEPELFENELKKFLHSLEN